MWSRIAQFIINYRLPSIVAIGIVTVFMGYHASNIELSREFARTVPPEDPDMIYFNQFKERFGEDGNIVALGILDSAIYELENFNKLHQLSLGLSKLPGVNTVVSVPLIKTIRKDTVNKKFYLKDLFPRPLASQVQLDSLMGTMRNQRLYMGQIVNPDNGATLILVSLRKEIVNSAVRETLIQDLVVIGKKFSDDTHIELRYAGLPFIRTEMSLQVRKELRLFLFLSMLVTGVIMFLFFRSFRAVVFSLIVIGVVVVWVLGTVVLLRYKITLLTGLIPPVIVTIGITNAIYLLNKYHLEFAKHFNKEAAIAAVVKKMGLATFLTNLTVAIGFLSLLSTDIVVLREFGIVAGINIMALFLVSLVIIPGIFSWLPGPGKKHLRHLDFKIMNAFVTAIDLLVHRHRLAIYGGAILLAIFSAYGISKLQSISFIVDDVPEDSQIKKDLLFFEANFSGIMPLEIEVDTGERRGILKVRTLQKVEELETFLDSLKGVSRPVSVISLVKASKQAFYNDNPARYALPDNRERGFILRYMQGQTDNAGILKSFVDSSYQKMRISLQIADIGSRKLDSLVGGVIEPKIKQIFSETKITATVTGSSKVFIKGNKFLIANLQESLLLAFMLITLSMALLFADLRMIIISLIPNLIALMITAGLMGYFHIPLKPSTALIFSITFGISVDNSIRFLAKYRQEQFANRFFVSLSVSESILETGKSIVYTSIVLFAGFIIFAFSSFGGTIALGVLTSTTLVISMFTNLILLPALIMTFDKPKKGKEERQLIDEIDTGFYGEQEDEAIDLSKIKIHDRLGSAE